MSAVEPASADYLHLQRQYFQTLEKYLDEGNGFCPFKTEACCQIIINALDNLKEAGWNLEHYAIMPNHLHKKKAKSAELDALLWADSR